MQYLEGEGFGPAVGWAMWYLGRGYTRTRVVEELLGLPETSFLSVREARAVVRQADFNRQATLRAQAEGASGNLASLFGQPIDSNERIGLRIVWDVDVATGLETAGRIFNVPAGMSLQDAISLATAYRAEMGADTPGLTPPEPGGLPGNPRIVSVFEGGFQGAIEL